MTNKFDQNDGADINSSIRTGLFIKDIDGTNNTNNLVITSVEQDHFIINKTTTNVTNKSVTLESRKLEIKTNEFLVVMNTE